MYLYAAAAIAAIIVLTIFQDRRMKHKDTSNRPLLLLGAGSAIFVCLAFPFIFSLIESMKAIFPETGFNLWIFLVTLLVCAILALILACAASFVLTANAGRVQNVKSGDEAGDYGEYVTEETPGFIYNGENFVDSAQNIDKMGIENIGGKAEEKADLEDHGKPFLEKAEWNLQDIQAAMHEHPFLNAFLNEIAPAAEIINEEADMLPMETADTDQEETGSLPVELDLAGWVDRAFAFKSEGKPQQALECCMKALSCNPEDDLVFWLILEVCVLYKSLGQADFARDVLKAYSVQYGHVMEPSLKAEIERNLM